MKTNSLEEVFLALARDLQELGGTELVSPHRNFVEMMANGSGSWRSALSVPV